MERENERERKRDVRRAVMNLAPSFMKRGGTISKPVALLELRDCRILHKVSSVTGWNMKYTLEPLHTRNCACIRTDGTVATRANRVATAQRSLSRLNHVHYHDTIQTYSDSLNAAIWCLL